MILKNGSSFEGRAEVKDGAIVFRGWIRPVRDTPPIERTWPMHGDIVREIRWLDA